MRRELKNVRKTSGKDLCDFHVVYSSGSFVSKLIARHALGGGRGPSATVYIQLDACLHSKHSM